MAARKGYRYAVEDHEIQFVVSGRDLLKLPSTMKVNRPLTLAAPNYAPPS